MKRVKNKRVELWAHIVSEHATIIGLDTPYDELLIHHTDEHDGPGTIRNHPRESRDFTLKKLGEVLAEDDG